MFKKKGQLTFNQLVIFPLFFFLFSGHQAAFGSQEIDSNTFKQLKYRHIGPPGNRFFPPRPATSQQKESSSY